MAEQEADAWPVLGNDIFLMIAAALSRSDLASALRVSKSWQAVLDGTARLWWAACKSEWASKVYVPAALRALAEGDDEQERRDLMASRVRELKNMLHSLRLQDDGGLIEKGDYADAILRARRLSAEQGTPTQQLLRRPSLLVRRGESGPKAALRLSLADAARTAITAEELTSFTFNVRLRHDGPLQQALAYDPWWQGKGNGEARYGQDGSVRFSWPEDPDNAGERLDPFLALGMSTSSVSFSWALEMEGRMVRLLFNGQPGPQEVVCRHPATWGWVLYSQGTCWTSWEMPPCTGGPGGQDPSHPLGASRGECSDPLLREEALRNLPSGVPNMYRFPTT
jgi:hypothetical protein